MEDKFKDFEIIQKIQEDENEKEFRYLNIGEFLGENIDAIYTESKNFNARRIVENEIRNDSMRLVMDELNQKTIYLPNTVHNNKVINLDKYLENGDLLFRDISGDVTKVKDENENINNEKYIIEVIDEEADAVIGKNINYPISMQVADCVAIYIYDPITKAFGLVHSGWRGTVNLIIVNTIEKLKKDFNVDPKDLKIILSPAISKDMYPAIKSKYTLFEEMLKNENMNETKYILNTDEKDIKKIDLKGIIKDILKEKYKIKEENILDINEDTLTSKNELGEFKYHSHIRGKDNAGRNMAVIFKNENKK